MKRPFLISALSGLDYAFAEIHRAAADAITAGQQLVIEIGDPTRSIEQNRALWPILAAWSKQKPWWVNGKPGHLTPEDWKNIHTVDFRKEMGRVAPNLTGGMVFLGASTRAMGKREFSAFLEYLHAISAQQDPPIDLSYVDGRFEEPHYIPGPREVA